MYILNLTISHGGAAEILGIRKSELLDIYDRLGYSYLDMTRDTLDLELEDILVKSIISCCWIS
jgi:hypothetical protein